MVWSFVLIFGVCEFGERLSFKFEEINDRYDQFAWYRFPSNIQCMLPVLIMVAQKPVRLCVFGKISCGRITLKTVSKKHKIQNQIEMTIFFSIYFSFG